MASLTGKGCKKDAKVACKLSRIFCLAFLAFLRPTVGRGKVDLMVLQAGGCLNETRNEAMDF
jgi:hypothetical protein